MLQFMDPSALASLAAIIGLVGRAAWPLLSTRVGVLRGQLLIGVAFAAHYALIGLVTAAIVNVLGSLQTATALLPLHARTARYAGCGLIVAMAGTTIATWAGPACVLVAVGQTFIAIARMQKDVALMFMLLLVGQLLWGVHDIVVGSPVAIAADAVGLLVGGCMLAWHCSATSRHSNSISRALQSQLVRQLPRLPARQGLADLGG
jgi:Bacterial inner membrane protein